ncbi:TylF/MycF/NovP-related O-methyltransferase [Maricaulis sp.]|uniref:TylF/MycF/NovP-related O-methyltransferase n=1 Tax=Maricaulis sp. TaxID=1486257 RepID=UPI003A9264E1
MSYLPEFPNIEKKLRFGRSVYAGYQRGWGLEFGGLREKILADPLYQEASALAGNRSVVSEPRRMNMFLLLKYFLGELPMGDVIEYGSYRGGNAIFMAYIAKKLHPGMKIYALDTFEGMPETDAAVDAHKLGDFNDANYTEIADFVAKSGLDNLVLVKGLFEDTNAELMKTVKKVRMAHIDCDIKPAVEFSYENVKKKMVEGGYYVFDDATVSSCIGATEVIENLVIRRDGLNSEQIWPHFVFRAFKKKK